MATTGWWARAAGNIPVSKDAAIRASGFYRRDPGYVDDPTKGSDVNNGHTYGGRASFLVNSDRRPATFALSAMAENIRSDGSNTVDLDPVTLKSAYGGLTHERLVQSRMTSRIGSTTRRSIMISGRSRWYRRPATALSTKQILEDASAVYGPLLTGALRIPLGAGVDRI